MKALKKKCWALFSRYIRLRDAKKNGSSTHAKCCTCGRVYHIKELQAGHFVSGRANAILFDEKCVHAQCVRCNMFKGGMGAEYSVFMLKTYGQEVIDNLIRQKNERLRFTEGELEEFEKWLKDKIKELGGWPS